MPLLLAVLVVILVTAAVWGGIAVSPLLWLVVVLAVAVFYAGAGRGRWW